MIARTRTIELCGGPYDGLLWKVRRGSIVVVVPVQILSPSILKDDPAPCGYRKATYVRRDSDGDRFDFQGFEE